MIWQAFAEANLVEEETRDLSVCLSPHLARHCRMEYVSQPLYIPRTSVLRRVTWELEGELELDVTVSRCQEVTHRLSCRGVAGTVAWPEALFPLLDARREEERLKRMGGFGSAPAYALPVFQAGARVDWNVRTMFGRGIARFTLDWEVVS